MFCGIVVDTGGGGNPCVTMVLSVLQICVCGREGKSHRGFDSISSREVPLLAFGVLILLLPLNLALARSVGGVGLGGDRRSIVPISTHCKLPLSCCEREHELGTRCWYGVSICYYGICVMEIWYKDSNSLSHWPYCPPQHSLCSAAKLL